jgi:uracil-DNA glycosylase
MNVAAAAFPLPLAHRHGQHGPGRAHWPAALPLPHPGPRNNIWLKAHPWFAAEVLPVLQPRVREIIAQRLP